MTVILYAIGVFCHGEDPSSWMFALLIVHRIIELLFLGIIIFAIFPRVVLESERSRPKFIQIIFKILFGFAIALFFVWLLIYGIHIKNSHNIHFGIRAGVETAYDIWYLLCVCSLGVSVRMFTRSFTGVIDKRVNIPLHYIFHSQKLSDQDANETIFFKNLSISVPVETRRVFRRHRSIHNRVSFLMVFLLAVAVTELVYTLVIMITRIERSYGGGGFAPFFLSNVFLVFVHMCLLITSRALPTTPAPET